MNARAVARIMVAAALLWATAGAVLRRWLCDDAFISFRYARNLVDGLGLVFNGEERVEGYTNFLWTMVCAAATALGLDPVAFAQWAGIACFVATIALLCRVGQRLLPGDHALLPLAALGCALHRHLQEFASCGLETASFVLLVVALFDSLLRAESRRQWAWAGLLAALLALSRPDGALFGLVGGTAALVVARRTRSLGVLTAYAAAPVVLGVCLGIFKLTYYGYLLPNTFYAKSGNDPYPSQGLYYLALYLATYWVLAPPLLALPVLLVLRPVSRTAALLQAFGLGYTAFVVWVGGDFMFGRFLLPVTPILFLTIEWGVRRFVPAEGRLAAAVAVGLATLLAFQHGGLQEREVWRGVGDERAQYPSERVAGIRTVGRRMAAMPGTSEARVVFFGTQAMLVYEAGFGYALEGTTGLTDAYLARMTIADRGRIGHEKSIYSAPAYALQRRVQFLLERYRTLTDVEPFRAIGFFGMSATIVYYDRELMRRLRGVEGVTFVDFEAFLDDYLANLEGKDPERVAADFGSFQLYYFAHNADPQRQQAFARFLSGR